MSPSMQYQRFSLAAVFWNSVDLTAISEPRSRACLGLDKTAISLLSEHFFKSRKPAFGVMGVNGMASTAQYAVYM